VGTIDRVAASPVEPDQELATVLLAACGMVLSWQTAAAAWPAE
jgi:hypothetical protein